jgi:hypothetical protein
MFALAATVAGVGPVLVIETSAWAATTVMLQLLVAIPGVGEAESWALTTKEERPAIVGVPLIAPVKELMGPKPGGSDPVIENVYGGVPPVATRLKELYATPAWAAPSGQVTVGGGVAVTVKVVEEVLLARFGSGVGEETMAVLATVPDELGLKTTSWTVAKPPAAMVPREQLTVPVPEQDPAGDAVADTNVVPAGRMSATVTLCARLGPALVTTMS